MIDRAARRAIIARLNDYFRITGKDGWHFLSVEVSALSVPVKDEIVSAVRGFDDFVPAFDVMGEHDCGYLVIEGQEIVWKITYYRRDHDKSLVPDPMNPIVTKRVMTIMSMEEYRDVAL